MTYTISVKDENGYSIPLKRIKAAKEEVLQAAWMFSMSATLCDVVVARGSKHFATYRKGLPKVWNGKDQKP